MSSGCSSSAAVDGWGSNNGLVGGIKGVEAGRARSGWKLCLRVAQASLQEEEVIRYNAWFTCLKVVVCIAVFRASRAHVHLTEPTSLCCDLTFNTCAQDMEIDS